MKRTVLVKGIIKRDGRTLLLKRSGGNGLAAGKYDLPGGELSDHEQPDEALGRYIIEETELNPVSYQLVDAVAYREDGDTSKQILVLVYLVIVNSMEAGLSLSSTSRRYSWKKIADMAMDDLVESASVLLSMSAPAEVISNPVDTMIGGASDVSMDKLIVYSDGGSRGNPGPSAAGFVVMTSDEKIVEQGGEYLGTTTNNQAEYHGVRIGLEKALQLGARSVDFRVDSLLVANQLRGIYKIKNRDLWPIYERIVELIAKFDKVTFSHIKREFNTLADHMVNRTLDARSDEL
ncbi:MAG: reverse transcriptase-like protein [Candidatus Saccharimonadaceae bacterium]